jgi:hypothetical protein
VSTTSDVDQSLSSGTVTDDDVDDRMNDAVANEEGRGDRAAGNVVDDDDDDDDVPREGGVENASAAWGDRDASIAAAIENFPFIEGVFTVDVWECA